MNYKIYKWYICGDLKVIAILMCLQKSCSKLCFFLCEWDSLARSVRYSKKNWPLCKLQTPGTKNLAHQFLVDRCKELRPPVHIKLGLMKNFVKVPSRNGHAFSSLCEKFPRLSTETIKAGVFIDPQIRQLFRNLQLDLALSDDEKAAWIAFRHVATGFLGNVKFANIRKHVDDLIACYEKLGCNVSVKMHFLHSRLVSFSVECGAVSDEHDYRFHQDISSMEKRCKDTWNAAMIADYCWTVKRGAPDIQ